MGGDREQVIQLMEVTQAALGAAAVEALQV